MVRVAGSVAEEKGTIAIHVRYRIKPGKKEELRRIIYNVIDHMQHEEDFVMTVAHDCLDEPDEIYLYEIWRCTREKFRAEQLPRPYRAEYNEALKTLVIERIGAWIEPDAEWRSSLTVKAGKRGSPDKNK